MLYIICAILSCLCVYAGDPVNDVEESNHEILIQEVFSFSRNPTRDGVWIYKPTVIVCDGTPITEARVRKAMGVWKKLGYDMDGPIMNSVIPQCFNDEYSFGNIVIDLRGQVFQEDKLALTKTYRITDTRMIVGVKIYIQGFASTTERTIEHELGHAFGWNHFNRRYHLMHEMHYYGGWDTYGLRRPRE